MLKFVRSVYPCVLGSGLLLFSASFANAQAKTDQDLPAAQVFPDDDLVEESLSGVNVLNRHPDHDQLAAAKQSLAKGLIVEMKNTAVVDFNAWLELGLPEPGALLNTLRVSAGSQVYQFSFTSSPTPAITAAYVDPAGALHGYVCERSPSLFPREGTASTCATGFRSWVTSESNSATSGASSEPDKDGWTTEAILSYDSGDAGGNTSIDRIRLFRLNDIDPKSDWYMIVRDPVSEPNLYHCVALIKCGWITTNRDYTSSLDRSLVSAPGFSLYDWSPKQANKTKTNQLSIGFTLSGVTPSPSVGYGLSWEQADVSATVRASVQQKESRWLEEFDTSSPLGPPENAKSSFVSHNAIIFQVPQGTSVFNVAAAARSDFKDSRGFFTYTNDISFTTNLRVPAPVFSVGLKQVNVVPKGKALVYLTSSIPGYAYRLKWKVQAAPSWLQVSPSAGSESGYLTFQENGTATPGSSGFVELTTAPAYAAPSVEAGPLRIAVQVVSKISSSGVLFAGGRPWNNYRPTASAEIWDPETGSVRATFNDMSASRQAHTATLLPNGKIVLIGGAGHNDAAIRDVDLFDPSTQMFSPTGMLITARSHHTATLLRNGQVLIAGGCCERYALNTAELYNPATGRFTATGNMVAARMSHTATLLPDGKVLITGGASDGADKTGLASAELYDPVTGTFKATGKMNVPRIGQTANLLKSGIVLLAGGTNTQDPASIAELYNPADGTFTRTGLTGTMADRRKFQASVELPNGHLVLGGGEDGLKTAEFYDPVPSWFFFTNGTMAEQRDRPTATLLLNTATLFDGKVLFAGGVAPNTGKSNGTLLEVFNPASELFYPAGNMSAPRTEMTATFFNQSTQIAEPEPR